TTRVDDAVIAQMVDIMKNEYGNPSSLHTRGAAAEQRLERARRQVLTALGAKEGRLLFTSGGTESNNLALFGASGALRRRGNRIVTTAMEHSSVIASCRELERRGFEVIFVSPGTDGRIDPAAFLEVCNENTILASMMLVNNELGTVQPIAELARGLRRKSPNALLHCDAVQAFGKIPFSVAQLGIDLMSVSGHKIHAPKGIGALYLAAGARILPILFGGEQQYRLRPGTESVPLAAALGVAAYEAQSELSANAERVRAVRARLVARLSAIEGICFHSPLEGEFSPYLLDFSVPGYRSETMLHFLAARSIFVSSGSACSKGAQSHVLAAMGKSPREIDSALRLSLCKYNVPEQADAFAEALLIAMQEIKRT
ncbi:MAG: cysteine desulfurase family protein, partial [Oscillospiraceae bacterium]